MTHNVTSSTVNHAIAKMSAHLRTINYTVSAITYTARDHGIVLATLSGKLVTNDNYAVWVFNENGDTFSGFYTNNFDDARIDFANRSRRVLKLIAR